MFPPKSRIIELKITTILSRYYFGMHLTKSILVHDVMKEREQLLFMFDSIFILDVECLILIVQLYTI